MDKNVLRKTSEKEWYYGELSDDKKTQNGIGLKREREGSFYYGLWENGLRAGFGTLCAPDGELVAGTWENDKSETIVLKVYPTGRAQAVFYGKTEKGAPGDGMLLCADGKLYYGLFSEWNKDDFNGEGALLWPDKRIYAGRWKRGGTDSGGVIRRAEGHTTGTLNNVRNGYTAKSWPAEAEKHFFYGITEDEEARNAKGILFYAEGEFFAGELRGGQRTGFGIYRSPDKSIYIGEWDNGAMQGQGMCIRWSAKSVDFYIGGFKNSLYDGEGCLLQRREDEWDFVYRGSWKDGKKSGRGIMNLKEEGVYTGGFAQDQRNGEGEITAPDGSSSRMNWKMGIPDIILEQVDGPGPLRSQYSEKETIRTAMLNSLKDGNEFGEEQCFVGIRADADAPYQRTMQLEPGCDYEIRIFYHNDADAETAGEEGTARETRLKAFFSRKIKPGENGVVSASIAFKSRSASVIWDGIMIQSAEELSISYKIASAQLYSDRKQKGRILPQTLFTEGIYLGTDELNGILPPGSRGYLLFVIHTSGERHGGSASFHAKAASVAEDSVRRREPDAARIRTEPAERKKKRRHSRVSVEIKAAAEKNEFAKSVSVGIGEEVPVKIVFTNGASDRNLVISAVLPPEFEYVSGSSILKLSDGSRRKAPDDWIREGLMLSDFRAEGEGEIQFKLRCFPQAVSSQSSTKIVAMIETEDTTMRSELLVVER